MQILKLLVWAYLFVSVFSVVGAFISHPASPIAKYFMKKNIEYGRFVNICLIVACGIGLLFGVLMACLTK